jgi:hypothetical protein
MNNIDLWFGDSYMVGAELSYSHGPYTLNADNHLFVRPERDRPDLAYPHLVSTQRNVPYINLGKGGSSIEFQVMKLTQFCKNTHNFNTTNYTAFFSLPPQDRGFKITNQGKEIHEKSTDRKWWHMNKELDVTVYNATKLINYLYLLCKEYNITPWFFSQVSLVELNNEIDIVPEENWLVSKNTCLINESFGLTECISSWEDRDNQNNPSFFVYIRPCENHPNILGHRVIAETILKKLPNKNVS